MPAFSHHFQHHGLKIVDEENEKKKRAGLREVKR
jgi:hypothetical protein